MEHEPGRPVAGGPAGAPARFSPHRPDHSPPNVLSDDELSRAIDSLARKLRSARRMLAVATLARLALYGVVAVGGVALLTLGPAPIVEYFQKSRQLVTTWDVFAWWFAILGATTVVGAIATQVIMRRKRRVAGWRHRVDDLARRLAEARDVQRRRGGQGSTA